MLQDARCYIAASVSLVGRYGDSEKQRSGLDLTFEGSIWLVLQKRKLLYFSNLIFPPNLKLKTEVHIRIEGS